MVYFLLGVSIWDVAAEEEKAMSGVQFVCVIWQVKQGTYSSQNHVIKSNLGHVWSLFSPVCLRIGLKIIPWCYLGSFCLGTHLGDISKTVLRNTASETKQLFLFTYGP